MVAGAEDRGMRDTGPRFRRRHDWQREEDSYLIILSLSGRERWYKLGLEG